MAKADPSAPPPSPKDKITFRLKGDSDAVPAYTTRASFEKLWADKGYEIVDDPSAEKPKASAGSAPARPGSDA